MSELSPRARQLLERCRLAEIPEAPARERVWGRVAGTVAVTTAATGSAGAAVGGAGAAVSGAGAAASGAPLAGAGLTTAVGVAKWVGIGMLAGTVTTATVSTMVGPSESERPSAAAAPWTAPSGTPASPPAAAPLPRLPATPPAPSSEPVPQETSSSLPSVTPVPDAPRSATSSLAAEARRLEAAQTALNEGNATAALVELDYYERDHARGVLSEEAAATRVLALCAAGRVAEARRAAGQFVARFPGSPLLARVRGSCATAPTIP